jgi:hypothetical protein
MPYRSWESKLEPGYIHTAEGVPLDCEIIYVETKTLGTTIRIEKNISLLTALIALGEGKQGLEDSQSLRA